MIKRIFKTYYVILIYPILYFPYKALNALLLVDVFGCSCDNPRFNANNITDIFWFLIGVLTIFLFIISFRKNFDLKNKIILFIISLVLIATYAVVLSIVFANSMYWD